MPLFFETIKIDDNHICNIKAHNKRLNETIASHYPINAPIDLSDHINPPITQGVLKCRVLYDKAIKSITYTPYKKRAIRSFKLIYDDIAYPFKYNDREAINQLFCKKGDCDDILIIKDGLLTDSSISNIAIFYQDIWITPKKPLLCGTFRAKLIADKSIALADITVDMLLKSKKISLLNAMLGFYKLDDFVIKY